MYNLQPYTLYLVNPFGTSHSVTTSRMNAYLELKHLDILGIAEVGLPPKKENCYFTDYVDIEKFLEIFTSLPAKENYNGFDNFQETKQYFKLTKGIALDFLNSQLSILDSIPNESIYLASKALFECALIDWYCKFNKQPISEFIGVQNHSNLVIPKQRNFYTLSLLDNVDDVLAQLHIGFPYTPNIKIKVGPDLDYVKTILLKVFDQIIKGGNYPGLLSIDCNCSWTPDIAIQFIDILNNELKDIQPFLFMIEQPFPLIFDKTQWLEVKSRYVQENIDIFADESVKTCKDVEDLQGVVTGINVKIEKSSGYRGAVLNFIKADELHLKKWVGIMIGSSLVANQAINLLGLATIGGDIDGTLLVKSECHKVEEQFIWHNQKSEYWGKIQLK